MNLALVLATKALAPELDAVAADGRFVADAIDHRDVAALATACARWIVSHEGDAPRRTFALARVPPDGGR